MKTFEIFESKQVIVEKKLISAALKLCESMYATLEAEGDFEWEPQPEFRGVKGTSSDTGFGVQQAKAAKEKSKLQAFAAQWNKLKQTYMAVRQKGDVAGAAKLYQHLQKLAAAAQQKGIRDLEMPPAPNEETRAI